MNTSVIIPNIKLDYQNKQVILFRTLIDEGFQLELPDLVIKKAADFPGDLFDLLKEIDQDALYYFWHDIEEIE